MHSVAHNDDRRKPPTYPQCQVHLFSVHSTAKKKRVDKGRLTS